MAAVGLLVMLEAKPGKEGERAAFLTGALPLAQAETTAWFAIKVDARHPGLLTFSRMRRAGRLISLAPSPRRSNPGRPATRLPGPTRKPACRSGPPVSAIESRITRPER
jgi:hypothetical protein